MGMAWDSGEIRKLDEGEKPKEREVVFREGELIEIRGCLFCIKQIFPNPDNELILKGIPNKKT